MTADNEFRKMINGLRLFTEGSSQYLDNCIHTDETLCASDLLEGLNTMANTYQERVKIGTDENGKAVYRWASGSTKDEFHEAVFRIKAEAKGIIPTKDKKGETFGEYALNWLETYKVPKVTVNTADKYRSELKQMSAVFGSKMLKDILLPHVGTGQIFINADGTLFSYQQERRMKERIYKLLGFEDFTMYDLRHNAVTMLMENGVSAKAVSAIAGHKDTRTTIDVYTHMTQKQKTEAAAVMNSMYADNVAQNAVQ